MAPFAAQARQAQPADQIPLGDEPIVPDSAFEEALPPLDPELITPLEPIEGLAPDPAPFPPVPGPVGDAPLGDPALSEPLPPLSVTDVEPADIGEVEDGGEPAPIRYTLVVEGLEGTDLEGRFRSLSALEDAHGEAVNGAMIAARAEEDEVLLVRLLRSEGYYDAVAASSIETVPENPRALRVVLTASPGYIYRLGEIRIDGPETVPPGLAREALALESGRPIIAAEVEAAEANVLLRLPQQGYPFPEIGLRDILLDPQTQIGDYTLPVTPGPRARFGGFTTEGNLAFDAEHVGVLARFERGDLYDRRRVDDLRESMVATRLFESVSAEPVLTGETAEDGTEYVNILVRQDAGPARSIDGQAGYSTGEGFRVEAAWEHRNLFPPEGALRFAAIAGTAEQNISVRFRRSNWRQRDRFLLLQLEAGQRDYEAFQGYTARLYGLVSRESTPIWQKVWTYAYGAEILATNESRQGRAQLSLSDAYFIGGLIGQVGYDRSNSLLDPTRGFRLLARVNPEASLGNGTDVYVRNLVEGSAYYPFGESFVLAGRARFGSIYGIARDDLAPSRRFYAGGGGSVRGFGFQELGPRDENNIPLGGRSLSEFAIEGRYRFGNYGAVAFVDAGQVYESQYPTFGDIRFGVGIGARLYTNFGPIRLDVATPISRREGESRVSVYVSIGQAF
ncbi:autotransporter assembly complex family protein [Sphingosinicella sp. CPCC 101087]|uniref:autotransporter assembly complex protein TamA n=1 Tax=Sphingosinicella sp. CPCC 101087 TaxID=2497754 RepID=UPI001FB05F52|nr:BamA/TamA family outer membrane protein [Sphingosinicella sp. CPCC 101087]